MVIVQGILLISPRPSAHRTKALPQQRTGSYVPEYLHSQHHAGPWHAMGELVSLQPPLVSWQHSRLEFRIIGHAATRGHEPGLLQRRLRLKWFHVVLWLTAPKRQFSNYSRWLQTTFPCGGERGQKALTPASSGHFGSWDEALHTQGSPLGMMCKCPETLLHGEREALQMRNRTDTS